MKEEKELVGISQSKLVCFGPMIGVNLIILRVQRPNEEDIFYRLGRELPLEHLMNDYCKRKSLARETVRFLFDGKRVRKTHTAELLKMDDDDIIDAFSEQYGVKFASFILYEKI
ncbi:hypothetical protein L6164_003250 [Bauhinia variegata]|uniref:Uncharacterized protein n=1 Tax=Bauhinia variegata TaxID=167791 RepID=A0ACB9Q289_BAUVA|nr:hypothetical protein L6164_003250 [Bauhinia variegata]